MMNTVKSALYHTFVIAFVAMAILLPLAYFAGHGTPLLSLQFTAYSVWSWSAAVAALGLFIYVGRQRLRSEEVLWLQTLLVFIMLLGVTDAFQCMATVHQTALFWSGITNAASFFVPIIMLFFAVVYTQPESRHGVLIPALFATADTVAFYTTTQRVTLTSSGVSSYAPSLVVYVSLWFFIPIIWSAVLLWRYGRTTPNKTLRAQTRIFFWAFLTPPIAFNIIEEALPALGFHTQMPFLLSYLFTVVLIVYGIKRHRVLTLSPSMFAQDILATMSESVIVTTPEFQIEYLNAGAGSLLHVEPEASRSKNLGDIFNKTTAGSLKQKLTDQSPGALELDIEIENRRLPISVLVSCIRNTDATVAGYILVFRDISKERAAKEVIENEVIIRTKELNEAQSQLIASIRSLPFGFAVVDLEGRMLFSNELLSKLVGQPIPEDPAASKQALKHIAANYTSAIDILGLISQAQTSRQPIEKNITFGPRFFRFFFMPIIEQKSADARAIGTVLIIEDTTEEKAAQRSRDEFFSIASHELRTPLSAIRGNSDMIIRYYPEPLKDPGLKEMVSDIHSASIRLISIVNDFLDMSRLEQGKFVFKNEPLEFVALIKEILREFDVSGSRRNLALDLQSPVDSLQVIADKDRVRQILVNLIGNAVKFTEHGSITLRLQPAKTTVKLFVIDTGQGIPAESQHLLFHKFQQASSDILTRDSTQSTGLGLYISRMLVIGMHGDLRLDHTEVGKGSTFVLELPLKRQTP